MRPWVLRPPVRFLPLTSDFSGSERVMSSFASQVWKRRAGEVGFCFLIAIWSASLRGRGTLEQLDPVARRKLDDSFLPAAGLAGGPATPLGLGLQAHRAHVHHVDVEDLLDRGADLRLVRAGMHPERVLVLGDQRVALLGDDRLPDDLVGVHCATALSRSRATAASCSRAASETTMWAAPITSATPASRPVSTETRAMFRNDSAHADSSSPRSTSTRPGASMRSSASAAALVEGSSNDEASIAQTLLRRACTLRAARS